MRSFLAGLTMVVLTTMAVPPAGAEPDPGAAPDYQTGYLRWRAADDGFAGWELAGASRGPGGLTLDPSHAQGASDAAGGYEGKNFYNGGAYIGREATSP